MELKTDNFDYHLPPELIAQQPAQPADTAKLMVLDRSSKNIHHTRFSNLNKFLPPKSILVFNHTQVQPVRLFGQKPTGGKVEVLILQLKPKITAWLHPGLKIGQQINIPSNLQTKLTLTVTQQNGKEFTLQATKGKITSSFLDKYGHIPLPPYIHSQEKENILRQWYQPIFAKEGFSVASPTASLHFTKKLLANLARDGFKSTSVRLDVGIGTFEPVKERNIKEHHMHHEFYSLSPQTAETLNQAKTKHHPIIAVGTTVARTLESNFSPEKGFTPTKGSLTNLFIYPPYKFQAIDGLITNFHLPKSTLLMMVTAFVSWPNTSFKFTSFKHSLIGRAYQEAINNNYHFFSFGDGMLIV